MREPHFASSKAKTRVNCVANAKLISAFVFISRIVQSLFLSYPNVHVSNLFYDFTVRFVSDFIGKPEDRYTRVAAHILSVLHVSSI